MRLPFQVVYCKSSEEDTIVSKANANKSIEIKSKYKSITVVEQEEQTEVLSGLYGTQLVEHGARKHHKGERCKCIFGVIAPFGCIYPLLVCRLTVGMLEHFWY